MSDKRMAGVVGIGALILAVGAIIYAFSNTSQNTASIVSPPTQKNTSSSSVSSNPPASTTSTPATVTQPATPSCVSASQAANLEDNGQTECVQFVGYQYTSSKGEMYLDQSTSPPYGFSVYIPAGTSFGPSVLDEYSGKEIDVTGTITAYGGEPEVIVSSASQITLAQ